MIATSLPHVTEIARPFRLPIGTEFMLSGRPWMLADQFKLHGETMLVGRSYDGCAWTCVPASEAKLGADAIDEHAMRHRYSICARKLPAL